MREWNFSPEQPIKLTIAADARLNPTEYIDDQIWEINLGNSEPPALSLQTTFGLRAPLCRIFPRFIFKDQVINNPAEFHHAITIHQYYANYLSLSFRPFSWLNVICEYWVPDSHAVCCRTRLVNASHDTCQFQVEWAELLIPAEDGHRMAATEIGLTTILVGQTANLTPLLYLLGGAQSGKSPFPSLSSTFSLRPREEQTMHWCHAALADTPASYEHARSMLENNLDAEYARIVRFDSQQPEIITGNHEWDNAFRLAQVIVNQLLISPGSDGNAPLCVYARNPDQGYSILKNGLDYTHLWNGLTPLDAHYLLHFLLPWEPGVVKALLYSFINSRADTGEIDLKPGAAGQRAQLLATPIISHMVWQYYLYTKDADFLRKSYPQLVSFFNSWFNAPHDRDNDTIPEWDQPVQTGFEDHPIFSIHGESPDWLNIECVESPELCSYLFQESLSLISIAKEIGNSESVLHLENISLELKSMIDQSWDDSTACYQYRDRDSHLSLPPEVLGKRNGPGLVDIHREFDQPLRPVIRIWCTKEGTRPAHIYLHGTSETGTHRVDHITPADIRWSQNSGSYTSKYIYRGIEQVEISGISAEDEVDIQSTNLRIFDHTLLMPLWAHIPTAEKAKILINLTILNKKKFLGPYGLNAWLNGPQISEGKPKYSLVHLPAVSMVLEGLLYYGQRKKAAELFSRIMKAVQLSLKQDLAFHQNYHIETGKPIGAANILTSLIPVGIFLEIAGIKVINPHQIEVLGGNPFPWPVTVKYRSLTVVHQDKKTLVIFPDGQNITVANHQPQVINTSLAPSSASE
ncbi:MAG: hypothetical protein C3F13_11620 [Anaerolineales bacterium]|nr:MAG: hypothetical protein C3F13_11620 [Anaerolineales bacterium]